MHMAYSYAIAAYIISLCQLLTPRLSTNINLACYTSTPQPPHIPSAPTSTDSSTHHTEDTMADNEGPQEELPMGPTPVNITFKDSNNNEVIIKLKGTTKLSKALDAFSARVERPTN
jgi:hypothetical protein